jgi:hypothetical protein
MDMTKVEGTNMMEEHDHLMKHRLGEEDMNIVKKHYHPMKHRLQVEDMDMVGIHMVEVGVWIWWRNITTQWTTNWRWRVLIRRIVIRERIWQLMWRWLKESMMVWCWWDIKPVMDQRGISELIGSGMSLRNQSVQNVTPYLQIGTPNVWHGIECRRVKKRVRMK